MKKITIRNKMHNTEHTFRIADEAFSIIEDAGPEPFCEVKLSESQVKRANRALCGMKGCSCGGLHRAGEEAGNGVWMFPIKED